MHPGIVIASPIALRSWLVMQMGKPLLTEAEITAEEGGVDAREDDSMFARGEDAVLV